MPVQHLSPDTLKGLSRRSDLQGSIRMLEHVGAIMTTGALLYLTRGALLFAAVFIVHGILINFLYAAEHELSHSTVFRNKKVNEWFGRAIGFILLTPRDADQIQHFAHHRHTQLWRQDGELYRPHFTLTFYLLRLSGLEYWYNAVAWLICCSAGHVDAPYMRDFERQVVIREARWHLLGYGAIVLVSMLLQSPAALIYWLAPMLATKAVQQLQNTIEHVGMPKVADISMNTRTIRTNAVMRWMGWNMQYHTAHHTYPSVPFHRLPALHKALFTERGEEPVTMGYLEFQILAIRALAARGEADYATDRAWFSPRPPAEEKHGQSAAI
jgi:fatty acid desaturase